MTQDRTYVWQMLREGIDAIGPKTTNVALRDWVLKKWPGTNLATVSAQAIACTVNHQRRVHYSENARARKSDTKMDFLFRPARGEIERFDPARQGTWEVAETSDGERVVRQVTDATGGVVHAAEAFPSSDPARSPSSGFAAEDHLRDFLATNLERGAYA